MCDLQCVYCDHQGIFGYHCVQYFFAEFGVSKVPGPADIVYALCVVCLVKHASPMQSVLAVASFDDNQVLFFFDSEYMYINTLL